MLSCSPGFISSPRPENCQWTLSSRLEKTKIRSFFLLSHPYPTESCLCTQQPRKTGFRRYSYLKLLKKDTIFLASTVYFQVLMRGGEKSAAVPAAELPGLSAEQSVAVHRLVSTLPAFKNLLRACTDPALAVWLGQTNPELEVIKNNIFVFQHPILFILFHSQTSRSVPFIFPSPFPFLFP